MGHAVLAGAGSAVLAASGAAALGAAGGILGGVAGLVGAFMAVRTNARTARAEYQAEIAAAKDAGAKAKEDALNPIIQNLRDLRDRDAAERAEVARRAEADVEFWRDQAMKRGHPGGAQ